FNEVNVTSTVTLRNPKCRVSEDIVALTSAAPAPLDRSISPTRSARSRIRWTSLESATIILSLPPPAGASDPQRRSDYYRVGPQDDAPNDTEPDIVGHRQVMQRRQMRWPWSTGSPIFSATTINSM